MEMNPNHEVTAAMREQWQKFAALLVAKQGGHAVITMADVQRMRSGMFLTVQELHDGIHLRLVDEATAEQLARKEGGLPL
jgi:acyl CoA:acetate/3-ketoacid CoA transferase beta subunit